MGHIRLWYAPCITFAEGRSVMNKILVFVVIVPVIALLMFKGIFFYEYGL